MTSQSGRNIRTLPLTMVLAGALLVPAACSQIGENFGSSSPEGGNTVRQQSAPLQETATSPAGPRTVSSPAQQARNAQESSQMPRPMARPKGLVDNRRLFDEPISDPIERIRRIEVAVQDLRDDFDTAIPAMAGLVVSESELSQVLEDLKRAGDLKYTDIAPPRSAGLPRNPLEPADRSRPESAVSEPRQIMKDRDQTPSRESTAKIAQADKPKPKPEPVKPKIEISKAGKDAAKKQEKEPSKELKGTHVVNVRIGSYPDKTRIVLDLTNPAQYEVDLDNDEKLLILEVKGAKWSARENYTFKDSPILSSFTSQDEDGNGSRLLIALKKPVKILKKFALKADGPRKDRIVLDIAAQ